MISSAAPVADLHASLALAETCCTAVSKALLEGEPEAIEDAARDLQQASLALAGMLPSRHGHALPNGALKLRLSKVAQSLSLQREALLRRAAVVERALHSIVPATQASTYAGNATPYGRGARQTGAFKLLSA
ncbi:MAG: hypothetical protein ABI343_15745 [Burkholderiaceae bacterium]